MDAEEKPSLVDRYGLRPRSRKDDVRGEYKAFGTLLGDVNMRETSEAVELRGLNDETEVIYYGSIIRFYTVGGVAIVLHGADFQVTIEGEHLQEMVNLLKRRQCDYGQVFDSKRFTPPPAQDEEGHPVPIITRMQVFNRYDFNPEGAAEV